MIRTRQTITSEGIITVTTIGIYSKLISPSISLYLHRSQSYERFILENRLNTIDEDINDLPIVDWKYLLQILRLNKDESKIKILSKED